MPTCYTIYENFTVWEAAAALQDCPPPTRQDYKRFQSTASQLADLIESGKLSANIVYKLRQTHMSLITLDGRSIPPQYEKTRNIDWENTKIARADLLNWCEQKPIRPPLLFPDPPPAVKKLHANERETLLAIIRALAELHGIQPGQDARAIALKFI